ncbi:MAG: GNAT family N-acetyltransferase [Gemmatimonadota bacterium]
MLRPFEAGDALEVQRLAGDRDVASTTLNIPHPYQDGMAESWIYGLPDAFVRGESATFAMEDATTSALIGSIGLRFTALHARGEVGYWIGRPYWGQGYCTEALRLVLTYGFEVCGLVRVYAHHLTRNPASGRVMQKVGMTHEGTLRKHFHKWGVFEDVELYGQLREEWDSKTG